MLKSREFFLLLVVLLLVYLTLTYFYLYKNNNSAGYNNNNNNNNSIYNIIEAFQGSENMNDTQIELLTKNDSLNSSDKVLSVDGKLVDKPENQQFPETIVEHQIKKIFESSLLMKCNLLHTMENTECSMNGVPFVRYLFPIHLLKLPRGDILAVFNDGRLYTKDSLLSNMWKGPLKNSIPFDYIPLRMITIGYRDNSLLGIGYDNKLYAKQADRLGNLNIEGEWVKVPNNDNIIYAIVEKKSKKLVAINTLGELLIKENVDLTSNYEVLGDTNIPIIKLFYDANDYMLALDSNFNLVQFKDRNWTQSSLNYEKGINPTKVLDILYDNDGKLYGLVFVPGVGILELMKQQTKYFMAEFIPLEFHTKYSLATSDNFMLNDIKIIETKTGVNMIEDNDDFGAEENRDDDLTYAYMKSIVKNKTKLRDFCNKRGLGNAQMFENYDMINNIQDQQRKIDELNGVIKNLLAYEPEKHEIQEEMLLMK